MRIELGNFTLRLPFFLKKIQKNAVDFDFYLKSILFLLVWKNFWMKSLFERFHALRGRFHTMRRPFHAMRRRFVGVFTKWGELVAFHWISGQNGFLHIWDTLYKLFFKWLTSNLRMIDDKDSHLHRTRSLSPSPGFPSW